MTGSLAEVRVGRSMQNPDASWDKWTTTIMVIRSASTLAGKNRNSDTSVVYVELPNPSNMQLSEFRQALPVNARVVLYLSRAASKAENPDVASVNGNDDIDSSLLTCRSAHKDSAWRMPKSRRGSCGPWLDRF